MTYEIREGHKLRIPPEDRILMDPLMGVEQDSK